MIMRHLILVILCLMGKLGYGTHVKAEGMVMLREAADEGHTGARELLNEYQSTNFTKTVVDLRTFCVLANMFICRLDFISITAFVSLSTLSRLKP